MSTFETESKPVQPESQKITKFKVYLGELWRATSGEQKPEHSHLAIVLAASDRLTNAARNKAVMQTLVRTLKVDQHLFGFVCVSCESETAFAIFDAADPSLQAWIKAACHAGKVPCVLKSASGQRLLFAPLPDNGDCLLQQPTMAAPISGDLMLSIVEGIGNVVTSGFARSILGVPVVDIERLRVTVMMPAALQEPIVVSTTVH
ncbi:hypothetical protein LNV47_19170 [Paucibacter sp. DJ4R-1]|nr:hypothetical protein [Paucibacter sp. DJ4R-1]